MTTANPATAELPLSEPAFEILLALCDGEMHGYAILQEVAHRTSDSVTLHAGTLYRALSRMLSRGWIEELGERPDPAMDDQRRRYYRITNFGRQVATAETRRLVSQVAAARTKNLISGGEVA